MMATRKLFAGQALLGSLPNDFVGVERDSRKAAPGAVFIAAGEDAAARQKHVNEAVAAGATAVLAETALDVSVSFALTPHARWSHARASACLNELDRGHVAILGVTGSAGKSTTTHCAWWALGQGAGRIGTLGWHDGQSESVGKQTTPPPEEIHQFLKALPTSCPGVAMEVSSHAADQQRLAGLQLSGLVFTGLGRDHLDYHKTVANYLSAKLKILRWLKPGAFCWINADDPHFHVVAHAARAVGAIPVGIGFGRGDIRILASADGGWRLWKDRVDHPLPVRLPGAFNAWNAAAGALLAHGAGVPLSTALTRLADMPGVPGRMELLAKSPRTYVDYAHTPESISTMLQAVRGQFPRAKIVCVFGCGGDRDRGKRGPMGVAALIADIAVLTTDNSRSESPRAIAEDVVRGIPQGMADIVWAEHDCMASGKRSMVVELDRARAIQLARRLAGKDGIVVVAGKGHETTQTIQGVVHDWDDRAFVQGLEAS
jgi:UDP-N-acetylmuramoyl-L-alanyl-D-glutamate--2,6-diaminopimelate ligase